MQSQVETTDYAAKGAEFAASYDKSKIPEFKNRISTDLIVTCMDPRLNSFLGSVNPDAITVRNAGGTTTEALRSVVLAHEIKIAHEVAVIHHTDCGLTHVTTAAARELVKKSHPGDENVARMVDEMDFYHIDNLEESVKKNVKYLKEHPLVRKDLKVSGWLYDLETGKITRVVEA